MKLSRRRPFKYGALPLSSHVVIALWWLLVLFQILSTTYVVVLAQLYANYWRPGSFFFTLSAQYLFTDSQVFLTHHYHLIGICYACLGALYIYGLSLTFYYTIRSRRLAFGATFIARPNRTKLVIELSDPADAKPPKRAHRWIEMLSNLRAKIRSIGIRGRYFTPRHMIAETIEIALQTAQAYRSSKYLSSQFVNQCYCVLIFLNCWSTPLLYVYWVERRNQEMMKRFTSILLDLILDFAWGTVIQFTMALPYINYYRSGGTATIGLLSDTMDRELQQIFVLSIENLVFCLFPLISAAITLRDIRKLLEDVQAASIRVIPVAVDQIPVRQESTPSERSNSTVLTSVRHFRVSQRWYHRIEVTHLVLMAIHGTVILIVSIFASDIFSHHKMPEVQCVDRLHPWFSNQEACVGRRINCSTLNISGQAEELDQQLSQLNPYLLANLQFCSCSALVMTASVHRFHDISTLEFHNVTLKSWSTEAAVEQQFFPRLQTVALVNSHFEQLPLGLIVSDLPDSLEWMAMQDVNAEELLDSVGDSWRQLKFLTCVSCGLHHFPSSLQLMPVMRDITLDRNPISFINGSDVAFGQDVFHLSLSHSPLMELPSSVWSLCERDATMALDLRYTNVSDVPAADRQAFSVLCSINAVGSGLCSNASITLDVSQVVCE